jgi:hypothetical protein
MNKEEIKNLTEKIQKEIYSYKYCECNFLFTFNKQVQSLEIKDITKIDSFHINSNRRCKSCNFYRIILSNGSKLSTDVKIEKYNGRLGQNNSTIKILCFCKPKFINIDTFIEHCINKTNCNLDLMQKLMNLEKKVENSNELIKKNTEEHEIKIKDIEKKVEIEKEEYKVLLKKENFENLKKKEVELELKKEVEFQNKLLEMEKINKEKNENLLKKKLEELDIKYSEKFQKFKEEMEIEKNFEIQKYKKELEEKNYELDVLSNHVAKIIDEEINEREEKIRKKLQVENDEFKIECFNIMKNNKKLKENFEKDLKDRNSVIDNLVLNNKDNTNQIEQLQHYKNIYKKDFEHIYSTIDFIGRVYGINAQLLKDRMSDIYSNGAVRFFNIINMQHTLLHLGFHQHLKKNGKLEEYYERHKDKKKKDYMILKYDFLLEKDLVYADKEIKALNELRNNEVHYESSLYKFINEIVNEENQNKKKKTSDKIESIIIDE